MKIFESYNINNLELKNRLIMPPMCTYQVFKRDGVATSFHQGHYISRAIGQTGLIIVEATGVLPNGRISDEDLGLYDDSQINNLKEIVEGCHLQGSKIAIQLNHAGRKSETTNLKHVGPSKTDFPSEYSELDESEIVEIIDAFKQAAIRAEQAGFDAIEIHGAHGYLIHQFCSPLSNFRTDEYGQDRFLFLKQIVQAIKTVYTKPIFLRISATDYHPDGLDVNDWINFFKENENLVDIVHVSSGGLISVPINLYPGYQLEFAKKIREQTKYPTIGVGLVNDPEFIVSSLELGYCDLIACGRELLRNPNLFLNLAHKYKKEDLIPFVYKRSYK